MTQAHHLLTDGEIQKIREREQKATNGPWEIGEPPSIYSEPPIYVVTTAKGIEGHALFMAYNWEGKGDDAAFVAHARQDIPALLADREELVRQNTEMEKTLHAIAICPDFYSNMDKLPGLARSCLKFLRSPQEP